MSGTVRIPPSPSGSDSHAAPTLASRVVARPPSRPLRPAVSDDRAGTPVPSSATHRILPSFNGLRTGGPSNDGSFDAPSAHVADPSPPTTEIDGDSSSVRRASASSPTARVARSTRFAPKFTPPTTFSSRSASPWQHDEPSSLAIRRAIGVIEPSMSSRDARGRALRPQSTHE